VLNELLAMLLIPQRRGGAEVYCLWLNSYERFGQAEAREPPNTIAFHALEVTGPHGFRARVHDQREPPSFTSNRTHSEPDSAETTLPQPIFRKESDAV
jgi:hypothetical protein